MNTHVCIKPGCGKSYSSEDEDAYYCEICLEEKNKIAVEVDKKMAGRVSTQVKSDLQVYNEIIENGGGVSKGGIRVVNAKDLGLL